jgi:phosphocarrier protein HPr
MTSPQEEAGMPDGASKHSDEAYGTRTVVVTNRHGLHARPCSTIVNAVGRHRATVMVQKDNRTVDASSVLDLMTLAATQGTELVISATGPEATEVLETLVRLFADEFGVAYTE